MDKVAKTYQARREDNIKKFQEKLDKTNNKQPKQDGGAEPKQATNDQS